MYSRSRLVGSGPGATPATRPAWDHSARSGQLDPLPGQRQGLESAPEDPSRDTPEHAGQRLQHTGAYTLITPNESRRNQIRRIAETELESLEKWKEQNRAKPVSLVPRPLGGRQSEAEVRQKQQLQMMQSKYQRKVRIHLFEFNFGKEFEYQHFQATEIIQLLYPKHKTFKPTAKKKLLKSKKSGREKWRRLPIIIQASGTLD